jgi:hypothetical protein
MKGESAKMKEKRQWLKIWLGHAEISEGVVFRRLIGRDQIHTGGRLEVDTDAATVCGEDQCGAVGDG